MEPSDDAVLSFLRRPDAYPGAIGPVSVVETHMSWVFLTQTEVYKLKKAIRQDGLDFSTAALRRHNCLEEVRLNRRLAPDVYRGVVAVTREADGTLSLDGPGEPVDWLVRMQRLPEQANLEQVLCTGRGQVETPAIRVAARALAHFFARATPVALAPSAYRHRLESGVRSDRDVLVQPQYGLSAPKVEALAAGQLRVVDRWQAVFEARVNEGHVVDGHGDLRPEHIWLGDPPAVIDCIEFDPVLRILDPADDLSFLALECERLGHAWVGQLFLEAYVEATGDRPPDLVLAFYRVFRALRRATIAARHLDDPAVSDPHRFLARAEAYLSMVEPVDAG